MNDSPRLPSAPALAGSTPRRFGLAIGCWLMAMAPAAQAGSAIALDGVNDHVALGPAPALGVSTLTVETWFRRSAAGVATSTGSGGVSAVPLVAKGRSEADGTNQDMNYFLGIRATDNVLVADFEEGAGGASPGLNHPVAGVTPIVNGVWYHAAASYDGSKWQLFLNGNLEAELVVGRPLRNDSIQHAALGTAMNSTGVASGFFAGAIDEVRIWNVARSSAQIAAGLNAEITSAAGLVGRWGMEENGGAAVADSSGSAVHGVLVNGPLWVAGFGTALPAQVTRGPYLQLGTPSSMIVRWRTDTATDGRVRFGASAGALTSVAGDAALGTEHEVLLTGLTPGSQYYYSVGTSAATLAGGADFFFRTAPASGTAQPTRVWVLGDSGTKGATAANVRNGYSTFNGNRYTDVWLMLGDNAYDNGTDAEFQAAVFNMYPSFLRQSVLWSTVGNHDTGQTTSPALTIPYFQIFNHPTTGVAGGAASGTEKYYSFDHGRIHFISLDSMTSSRTPGSPMLTWLEADLGSTTQDWIIAFWHHPPYTKGSHNSDTETQLMEMRSNVLPILEAGGVDLVLTGHSHSYERSYFLNGHYGASGTLTAAMKVEAGSGRTDAAGGAYDKPADLAASAGAVYVVAGNGGHVTSWTGGSTAEFNPTPHPAMYLSALHTGSLVLDIDGNRLDARMIRESGLIDDYFTILKSDPTPPPPPPVLPAAPSALMASAVFRTQINLSWADNAGNETGYLVERSTSATTGFVQVASLGANATTFSNTGLRSNRLYYFRVRASNASGNSAYSNTVSAKTLK